MAPQATAVKQQTPLLQKLSPELRNLVYELVVDDDIDINVILQRQPPLTLTCREVRSECLAMYYARNTFFFDTTSNDDTAFDGLVQWLERIGTGHCSNLGRLCIVIGVEDGVMIRDPRVVTDQWTTIVHRLKELGCSPLMQVDVFCNKAERPAERFTEVLSTLQESAPWNAVEHWRMHLQSALNLYFRPTLHAAAADGWDLLTCLRYCIFEFDRRIFDRQAMLQPPLELEEAYRKIEQMQEELGRLGQDWNAKRLRRV
ncbi:hypothetical protein LTR85_011938 [Meristemomyces frigidus]|nr:hypothetical protein LTR85_011938 [Meristemomyces frigidus]